MELMSCYQFYIMLCVAKAMIYMTLIAALYKYSEQFVELKQMEAL